MKTIVSQINPKLLVWHVNSMSLNDLNPNILQRDIFKIVKSIIYKKIYVIKTIISHMNHVNSTHGNDRSLLNGLTLYNSQRTHIQCKATKHKIYYYTVYLISKEEKETSLYLQIKNIT